MEEVKDIVLNVYALSVQPPPPPTPSQSQTSQQQQSGTTTSISRGNTSWTSFLVGKMLPSIGMGAYHTSLRIGSTTDTTRDAYTTTYTFVAQQGIVSEKRSRNTTAVPSHATFKEEIVLGSCTCPRGQVNEIISLLSQYYFTPNSYHLVHRNCNHFTETLATALIHYREFMDHHMHQINGSSDIGTRRPPQPRRSTARLSTYPDWINRLASTGANVISHDADIVPCQPYHEAYHAVTKTTLDPSSGSDPAGGRGGGFSSVLSPGSKTNATPTSLASASTATTAAMASKSKTKDKKELTEAQKKLLEKIRKK